MGGVFLIHDDGKLVEMAEQRYDTEDLLQDLIAKYPSVLSGDQTVADKPRRWLLVSREVAVPGEEGGADRWSLDHLFLDQDAIPTFIEVKRSSDTRIRREVVGQMLDYAANAIVYWPVEVIQAKLRARCEHEHLDLERLLSDRLGVEGPDQNSFWLDVKTNLQAGRVRMVFVSDEIPAELQRIVEFLHEQMDPAEVLAVEMKQYVREGRKILVPRIVGRTAAPKPSGREWDAPTFMQELQVRTSTAEVEVARKILAWSQEKVGELCWGRGGRSGSFIPVFVHDGVRHQLFAVYTYGSLEVYFQYYAAKKPFDSEERRREILTRLNEIPGVRLPANSIARRPSIPLKALRNPGGLKTLLGTFDWILEQIRLSSSERADAKEEG